MLHRRLVKVGSDWITVHAEATVHLNRTVAMIPRAGHQGGGVRQSGDAALPDRTDPVQNRPLLVMTVNPGFGGQKSSRAPSPESNGEGDDLHHSPGGPAGGGRQASP